MPEPFDFTACEALELIRRKKLGVLELLDSCLSRIEALEPEINAWKFLAPEAARDRAKKLDNSDPGSPLHGIPLGVKDVIDTADMPSGYGSPIYERYRPMADAACVAVAHSVDHGRIGLQRHARPQPVGEHRRDHRPVRRLAGFLFDDRCHG